MKRKSVPASRLKSSTKHSHFHPAAVIPAFLVGALGMFMVNQVFGQMQNDSINACVNKVNGSVRVVAANGDCKNNETALSWNKQGPKGDPGSGGSTGSRLNNPFFCNQCYLTSYADQFAGKDFSKSQVTNSEFSNADLAGVNFSASYFKDVNFSNASLTNANLSNIKDIDGWGPVRNNIFSGANLTNANLSGSMFHSSDFTNANLQGANFSNTTIRYSDMSGAKNASTANFTGATWEDTRCPDGTNSDSHGATCVGHF
jgi:uncharacterized protein YjbI with pentapeptide repeats